MNVYMTMVRPGLFLQREGPGRPVGSEPGNSLWHLEGSLEVAVLLYGLLGAFRVRYLTLERRSAYKDGC